MSRHFERLLSILGAMLLVAVCLAVGNPVASADSVPFTDSNSSGYLGFCDQNGHQITSGKVADAPFVYRAVSSVAAPAGYGAPGGRAVLNAYQPRKNVDPQEWSGKQLIGSSTFTNSAHPMVQGTGHDVALVDFTGAFPASWDGLVQLRMYYGVIGNGVHANPYPAAVVKISGSTWTAVTKGDVDCSSGSATSLAAATLPTSILDGPTTRVTAGGNAAAATKGAKSSGAPDGVGSSDGTNGSGTGSIDLANTAASKHEGSDTTTGLVLGAIAVGVLLATGGILFYRRRPAMKV